MSKRKGKRRKKAATTVAAKKRRKVVRRKPVKRKPVKRKPVKRKPRKPIPKRTKPTIKAPKGYKPIAGDIDDIDREITSMVEGARDSGFPYANQYSKSRNKDGTFDAEWRVTEIPRGVSVSEVLHAMRESLHPIAHTYIRVVLRYLAPEGVDSGDRRYRGLTEAWSAFYNNGPKRKKIGLNMIQLAVMRPNKGMAARIEKRKRRKPSEVLIRWHWNGMSISPGEMAKRYRKRFKRQ